MADAAAGADDTDDVEDDVLGRHALGEFTVDGDGHPPRAALRQCLRGEHVFDLARADTERQGAECTVGGGVAVAAHHGHPRQGAALLGCDHVDDALQRIAHREVDDPELGGVLTEHLHLAGGDQIGDRLVDVRGGNVVVFGGHREVGAAHGAAAEAEPVEGLRTGDFVHQMQVDVEQVGLVGCFVHEVALPDLLGQGLLGQGLRFRHHDSVRRSQDVG